MQEEKRNGLTNDEIVKLYMDVYEADIDLFNMLPIPLVVLKQAPELYSHELTKEDIDLTVRRYDQQKEHNFAKLETLKEELIKE